MTSPRGLLRHTRPSTLGSPTALMACRRPPGHTRLSHLPPCPMTIWPLKFCPKIGDDPEEPIDLFPVFGDDPEASMDYCPTNWNPPAQSQTSVQPAVDTASRSTAAPVLRRCRKKRFQSISFMKTTSVWPTSHHHQILTQYKMQ